MKWIKVEDEFPPVDTHILFYAGRIHFGEYCWYDPGYRFCEDHVGYIDDVTHWMSLPSKPEEK